MLSKGPTFQLYSFACGYPVFPVPFVEKTVLYWMVLAPCQKSFHHIIKSLFLARYSIPLIYMSVFMPMLHLLHCFDYDSFVLGFEIRTCESSSFVLFFSILFQLFGVPWNSIWILGWIFLFLQKISLEF